MKITRTYVSDRRDAQRKKERTDELSRERNFAVTAAKKIAENPSLLEGLARVVGEISKHDEAAEILDKVFEKGAAKKYPRAYRAFIQARF